MNRPILLVFLSLAAILPTSALSTDAPPAERYDYWLRSIIYNLEVSRLDEAQLHGLR